jgi:ferrous iron transport protein A
MFPIGLLSPGERGEIVAIRETAGCNCDCRVEDLGLRVGKTVEMLNNAGSGALLLKVDESRLALGRGLAKRIMVRQAS